ncbi:MAG TPA: S8 family serine peptidase, partial [Mycobacteriales bacterium]|nr:S8 family serine peptidase [Mycobacteriales bacterium]
VGIAPRARILPVRVSGGPAETGRPRVATGIRWAVDHGAKVINASVGQDGQCLPEVQDAVGYAVRRGAVVVVSAGNDGRSGNTPQFPADCAGVLTVGAVDADRHAWAGSTRGSYVDVAAPGVQMASINASGQSGKSEGSSDASALTAAAVALVWSKYPALTNRQVLARLLATLRDDADRPGVDPATGAGLVRPYNAITAAVPADAPNPIFDQLPPPGGAPDSPDPSQAPAPPVLPGRPDPTGSITPGTAAPASPSAVATGGVPGVLLVAGLAVVALLAVLITVLLARRRRPAAPPPWPPPGGPPQ